MRFGTSHLVVPDPISLKKPSDLLDFVDILRSQVIKQDEEIERSVSLPQVIVCGEPSSGRTSVLEAISGVPLPIRGTPFSTELILRRTPQMRAIVTIVPDCAETDASKEKLAGFHGELESFDGLSELINDAKCMIISANPGAIVSKDLLQVKVLGPGQPDLTLVNMPGLGRSMDRETSGSDSTSDSDIMSKPNTSSVEELWHSSMKRPRSIILAVVSAHDDFANQRVLKLARSVDDRGDRTLGVITKPDTLLSKSESESQCLSLAQNNDLYETWHVLKNPTSGARGESLATRDQREMEFFKGTIWKNVPDSYLGIYELREMLNKMLLWKVKHELPVLTQDIKILRSTCQRDLEKLGEPRTTFQQQQRYLIEVVQSFQQLVRSGIDGDWSHEFFKETLDVDHRIRATIRYKNEVFAISLPNGDRIRNVVDPENEELGNPPTYDNRKYLTKDQSFEYMAEKIRESRGRQLPGLFHPEVVADVFHDQAAPWEDIALEHVNKTWKSCEVFLEDVFDHVADDWTSSALKDEILQPAMESIRVAMDAKTKEIVASHQNTHLITYNDDFTKALQDMTRQRERWRVTDTVTKTLHQFFGVNSLSTPISETPVQKDKQYLHDLLKALVDNNPQPDIHQIAALGALDQVKAYYKVRSNSMYSDD